MYVNGCGSRLEAIWLNGYGQPVWNRWRKVECLRPRRRGNHGILEKVGGPVLRLGIDPRETNIGTNKEQFLAILQ